MQPWHRYMLRLKGLPFVSCFTTKFTETSVLFHGVSLGNFNGLHIGKKSKLRLLQFYSAVSTQASKLFRNFYGKEKDAKL